MLQSVVIGLAFGTAISYFNHWLIISGIKKNQDAGAQKINNAIGARFLLRMMLDFAALFVVYLYGDVPMLVATAVGLTMARNIEFAVKFLSGGGGD